MTSDDRFTTLATRSTEQFLAKDATLYCPHGGGFANQLTEAGRVIKSIVEATEELDVTSLSENERRSLHDLLLHLANIAVSPAGAVGRAYAFHTLALMTNNLPADVIVPYLLHVALQLHQRPELAREEFKSMMGCIMFSGNSLSKLSGEFTDFLLEVPLESLKNSTYVAPGKEPLVVS